MGKSGNAALRQLVPGLAFALKCSFHRGFFIVRSPGTWIHFTDQGKTAHVLPGCFGDGNPFREPVFIRPRASGYRHKVPVSPL